MRHVDNAPVTDWSHKKVSAIKRCQEPFLGFW
jgi:hypothetical protein